MEILLGQFAINLHDFQNTVIQIIMLSNVKYPVETFKW